MTQIDSIAASEIESYFDRLWPITRSITGPGVRETHDILSEIVPLQRIEIPSGTQVFDWSVPKEWIVRDAYIMTPTGDRICDVHDNNLHLVNYSIPHEGAMPLAALRDHIHTLPELPDAIPYVTSYYQPRWGFCMSQNQLDSLPEGDYQVHIDTELINGSMTLSHLVLPGESTDEVLISTYTCHPSMANNELSGPLVAAFLARHLASQPNRRLTYRFVFVPETIGSIAYLAQFGDHLKDRVVAGYVLSCMGDPGAFTYKRSRRAGSLADRVAEMTLRESGSAHSVLDFWPGGSDERQYCSPGFDLPVGVMTRTIYTRYPEYHTSLDNRSFISFEALKESIEMMMSACDNLETDRSYARQNVGRNVESPRATEASHASPHALASVATIARTDPRCEPFLSKYGLYESLGARRSSSELKRAIQWVLNLADGRHDLLGIAKRSGIPINTVTEAAEACERVGLIHRTESEAST